MRALLGILVLPAIAGVGYLLSTTSISGEGETSAASSSSASAAPATVVIDLPGYLDTRYRASALDHAEGFDGRDRSEVDLPAPGDVKHAAISVAWDPGNDPRTQELSVSFARLRSCGHSGDACVTGADLARTKAASPIRFELDVPPLEAHEWLAVVVQEPEIVAHGDVSVIAHDAQAFRVSGVLVYDAGGS